VAQRAARAAAWSWILHDAAVNVRAAKVMRELSGMRPTPKYAVLAVVGLAILYVGVGWIIEVLRNDEERVRLVFEEVSRYARERDSGAVVEYIDPEYHDPQGYNYAEAKRIVQQYFLSATSVEVELEPLGVEGLAVEGDEVDVLVRARVALHVRGEVLTLQEAHIRGEYVVVCLRRCGSYFRAKSIRPARSEEVPER
jgi:hypothetical protein